MNQPLYRRVIWGVICGGALLVGGGGALGQAGEGPKVTVTLSADAKAEAVSPLFLRDVIRHQSVLRVYGVWLAVSLPVVVAIQLLWDAPAWHAFVPQMLGP